MDENIEHYRNSMVTAIGIILGFLLAFTASWASALPNDADWSDYSIGIGLFTSILLQIWSLYRMLDNGTPEAEKSDAYRFTLKLFIIGILISFFGLAGSVIQTILTPVS